MSVKEGGGLINAINQADPIEHNGTLIGKQITMIEINWKLNKC